MIYPEKINSQTKQIGEAKGRRKQEKIVEWMRANYG